MGDRNRIYNVDVHMVGHYRGQLNLQKGGYLSFIRTAFLPLLPRLAADARSSTLLA